MPVALPQPHQNPSQAFWVCFKQLVEHFAKVFKVVIDDRCAQYASRLSSSHWQAPSVPPAHADACDYFLYYLRLKSVHNTSESVSVTFDHHPQVVSRTEFPHMPVDRSIRRLSSTSAVLVAARQRGIGILSHHHSKKYQIFKNTARNITIHTSEVRLLPWLPQPFG